MEHISSLVGHTKVKQFLVRSLDLGQIAHAYIFCGPAHVGKTKMAECFAAVDECVVAAPRLGNNN